MMKNLISFVKDFGDVDKPSGIFVALAIPVFAVMLAGLVLAESFGALQQPQGKNIAFTQAEQTIKEMKDGTPKEALTSFYYGHDGSVEARAILHTANSRSQYYSPFRSLFGMTLAAIACLLCGAAVALKIASGSVNLTAKPQTAKLYQMARIGSRITSGLCGVYVILASVEIGLGSVVWVIIEKAIG